MMSKKNKQPETTPPIVDETQAEHIEPDLPPPGHERDELLAQRQDALEQEIEERMATSDIHAVDPRSFEPDRELQDLISTHNALEVKPRVPGHEYCWVYTGLGGQKIWEKKYWGWVVVQGDDPECAELKSEDSTRRIGDTILMRIPLDVFDKLEAAWDRRRQLQAGSVDSEIFELADKHRHTGIRVRRGDEALSSGRPVMDTLESRASQQRKHYARQVVSDNVMKGQQR